MKKFQLTNGLRVVMEEIPTCRSVALGIWVKTGSRNETKQNSGISHFIEHMLFKGTEQFSAKDIAEQFDSIGGNVNAFTSKEYTCYYAKVLDRHLPVAVRVLSDMFFHSTFDPDELAKEKKVILEEIAMYEDTPDDLVHDLVSQAAFGDHPLAYSILGNEDSLAEMNAERLKSYMHSHYHLQNTVISIAGNVDESVIELMETYFGSFNRQGMQDEIVQPVFQGDVIFRKKSTEQNHICLSFPGCSVSEPRLYAMILFNNLLGGGMSSRLFQEIREKRGLAYSVYSYHSSHIDSGLLTIYAGTAPKQTKTVLDLTLEILQETIAKGLTEAEVEKGKEQLKGSLILSLESTSSRMNRLGKNELMLGKHYTLDELIDRIDAVTMNDIQSLFEQTFSVPYALAMVGDNDRVIEGIRREPLVQHSS